MTRLDSSKDRTKHLAMMQDVINRMGYNSFLIKGWSFVLMTLTSALLIRKGDPPLILLIIIISIGFLWFLDAYFLSLERKYRELYDRVRISTNPPDFNMSLPSDLTPHSGMWCSFFAKTLVSFYLFLTLITVLTYLAIRGVWHG